MPRVKAANENMAKYLKHPITKIGFAGDVNMTVNWPDDTFTNRRIRDGDVTVVEDEPSAEHKAVKDGKRAEGESHEIKPDAAKPFAQ